MSKVFDRIIYFHVQGEIDNNAECSPESIINNYNWGFTENNYGTVSLIGHHKDSRGRITKMTKLPRITKWKKPDNEFFLKM